MHRRPPPGPAARPRRRLHDRPRRLRHRAAARRRTRRQLGGQWNHLTSCGPDATQTVFHLHGHLVPRAADDGLALPWTRPIREQEPTR
ncbi:HIT domain-containing protein [Streptomyces sp. NPDC051658]|uniref:HIT domain-containing protein n=1 Tax=Streptomyces sp. NPDC051658 TaxID=3365667 RepID=UPI0037B85935